MIKADLHMHSTVSDGSFTIPELIEFERKRDLMRLQSLIMIQYRIFSRFRKLSIELK